MAHWHTSSFLDDLAPVAANDRKSPGKVDLQKATPLVSSHTMRCLCAAVHRAAQGAIHAEVATIAPVNCQTKLELIQKLRATISAKPRRERKHALCTKSAPPHTGLGRDPCAVAQRALIIEKAQMDSNGAASLTTFTQNTSLCLEPTSTVTFAFIRFALSLMC